MKLYSQYENFHDLLVFKTDIPHPTIPDFYCEFRVNTAMNISAIFIWGIDEIE